MTNASLFYRYWWNIGIFSFTKNSYLHRTQWRYYFYLSRVRILVSPWLLTWWANHKRASRGRFFWNFIHKMASRCEDGTFTGDFLDKLPNFHIDTFCELKEHSGRFAEVSESDVEKIHWKLILKICLLCRNFISIYKINR